MLDAKFIRENPDKVKESLKKRKDPFDLDAFLSLDERRRGLLTQIEELRASQNKIDTQMKALLREKKDAKEKIEEAKQIKQKISDIDSDFKKIDEDFKDSLLKIPNIPDQAVPLGDESKNKIVKEWGKRREFGFKPLSHIELSQHLDIIDFKRAAKLTGSNFVLFKGAGARLQRALIDFMLDLHTKEHGYTEVWPPSLVNRQSMISTGQLPKLEEDMYNVGEDDYFLIPTAEVPLTNIHRDETLDEKSLPIYYTAYSPCYRREAGSYGKETRGLVRVHQFDKIELVKFTKPQDSYDELDKLLADACSVLELLEIPYRVNLLASEEISFAAAKCYDIETYAPGIDKWLEVSSCSNFEDFQARRSNIRYKDAKGNKPAFIHTLNGSGLALPRLVVVILEQYQQKDGSILIPQALRRYIDDREVIKA